MARQASHPFAKGWRILKRKSLELVNEPRQPRIPTQSIGIEQVVDGGGGGGGVAVTLLPPPHY